jgi:hypothetical protein
MTVKLRAHAIVDCASTVRFDRIRRTQGLAVHWQRLMEAVALVMHGAGRLAAQRLLRVLIHDRV